MIGSAACCAEWLRLSAQFLPADWRVHSAGKYLLALRRINNLQVLSGEQVVTSLVGINIALRPILSRAARKNASELSAGACSISQMKLPRQYREWWADAERWGSRLNTLTPSGPRLFMMFKPP
jgi:hypothetical protein